MAEPASICICRRVAWMDTDAAGIYHWTTIARFSEAAEVALYEALGFLAETFGSLPRLRIELEFHRSLRFHDEAWVSLTVDKVGRSSVTYRLKVTDMDSESVASGEITTCLVDSEGRSRPWPDPIRAALTTGGAQAPQSTA